MRTSLKVLAWALAFAAAAGAGAYVAAHTDPFPPGVTDPGERPTVPPSAPASISPSASPAPIVVRWQVRAKVRSVHELHVGGSCRSDWDVQAVVSERGEGRLAGEGLATLTGDAGCSFATADVQAETVLLRMTGTPPGGGTSLFALRVTPTADPRPPGSKDLGGFVALLDPAPVRAARNGLAKMTLQRPDGNDGRYRATWSIRIRCVAGC